MTGIIYADSSIRKCFNHTNLSQNTSIKNQKSAQNKPFNENLRNLYQTKRLSHTVKKQDI